MYLFFDTETTGLPKNWRAPVTDINNWPRLVQLACLLYDEQANKIASGDFIIKPEGFVIPAEVSRIHGITHERALLEGEPILPILEVFVEILGKAEFVVAHNMRFDENVVGAEFLRHGMANALAPKRKICTMTNSAAFVGLTTEFGFKWPKLSELHYKLFQNGIKDSHNAAIDIEATAKCFWELRRLGII